MSDTFLPGSGFDTYESQDKVLVQMDGSRECAVAVRILQQQGFAVAGAAVRLAAEQTADAESAKKAAEALGIECIVLNAEALAGQDARNAHVHRNDEHDVEDDVEHRREHQKIQRCFAVADPS